MLYGSTVVGRGTVLRRFVTAVLVVTLAGACRSPSRPEPSAAGSLAPVSPSAPRASAVAPGSVTPAPLGPGAALQRRLASLEVFVDAEPPRPMVVPAEARRVLVDLKDALLESVDRRLAPALEQAAPEAALGEALASEGYLWMERRAEPAAVDVAVRALPEHRERWGVTLCLIVSPGMDCVLAVYERRGGALRRSLVVRSDLYASIEGAVHALAWTASPPDSRDGYYVVEAHTHPWPASRFRKFWYRALAPGESADEPIALASGAEFGIWENGFRLAAEAERFSVSFDEGSDQGPGFEKTKKREWVKRADRFVRR